MRLPGDEVVPGSLPTVTTVVTIAAAPETVWPWVVQIGRGRASLYIYTWLGNALGAHIRLLSRHCVAPPRGLPARMAATFWSQCRCCVGHSADAMQMHRLPAPPTRSGRCGPVPASGTLRGHCTRALGGFRDLH